MLFPGPHSLLANEAVSQGSVIMVRRYNVKQKELRQIRAGGGSRAEVALDDGLVSVTPKRQNARFDSPRVDCQVSHRHHTYYALAGILPEGGDRKALPLYI